MPDHPLDATAAAPGAPPAEIVPAATVALLRDGPGGIETLLLQRNRELAFAGGHSVFPGGRIDAADLAGAGLPPELPVFAEDRLEALIADESLGAAARTAAARETLEETGLVLAGAPLVWFAHWMPPVQRSRRFATWFFAAPAPAGTVVVDGGEIHDHAWLAPADALRRRDEGTIALSPPTWVTLWQLRAYASTAEALDALAAAPPQRFATKLVPADDHLAALWEGDAGYETGDAGRPGARHRLEMRDGGWRYRRDPAPVPPVP